MKNPALVTLVTVAALAALIAAVLVAVSISGLTDTLGMNPDGAGFRTTRGLEVWVAAIPAAVAVVAGIAAIVVWGSNRQTD